MLLKEIYEKLPYFNYLVNKLNIQSSIANEKLFNTSFSNNATSLNDEFDKIDKVIGVINHNSKIINDLGIKLCRIRKIDGTIRNINSNNILDDIELFEIKSFCMLSNEIKGIYDPLNLQVVVIPDLSEIINILDPEQTNVPSFYIYDSYSKELADIRKEIKKATAVNNRDLIEKLRFDEGTIEDQVRANLSLKLKNHTKNITTAVNSIAKLDILFAKAQQSYEMEFCKPQIIDNKSATLYKGLYNPQLKDALSKKALLYQPVDITLYKSPCLITGANMSGKTVMLKTVALAQYLTQFGFYIPAEKAQVALVDEIMLCMDEEYDELQGLSSYAAEILKVNEIIAHIKSNNNILVLIDELARTTNPVEGRKIVSATLQFLDNNNVRGLITTHYGDISYKTRRLRVKGLTVNSDNTKLTIDNINRYIDYSLVETDSNDVPHEALKIAALLGVDKEFIELCKKY